MIKSKIKILIILLLAVIILSGCDISGIIPPISEDNNISPLTPEEIELIRKWGFGGDYVVRWPDGYVDVYDATNYSQMQEVLNQWNAVIGGPVILRLSSNPNSQVKVYYKLIFGYCGNCDVKWNEDYTFSTIDIQISDNAASCGYPSSKYALYLFMFKNVAGFKGWTTKGEGVPYEEWTNFTEINDTMKKMVKALYKVPPGYCLIEEPKPDTIIELEPVNCQVYPDYCYGCWQRPSIFGGYNIIDFSSSPRITLKTKEGSLPENMKISIEGIKFDISKNFSFSGSGCSNQPESMSGDWGSASFIIAETSYKNGELIDRKYEEDNGYVIEADLNKSEIYIRLSNKRGSAFKATPYKSIKMKIFDLDGKKIGEYNFNAGIIPKVESYFGQCVWWAIKRKYETDGTVITSPFYPPPGGIKITQNYSPKKHDILVAYYNGVEHYAFIENVNGPIVTISQFNYPEQERKSIQKLRWNNNTLTWTVPYINDCKYYFQFNYYIR